MSQSKGLMISEVKHFKTELEAEMSQMLNSALSLDYLTEDVYSGLYERTGQNTSGNLEIRYLGNRLIQVKGIALWGTENQFGPNFGEVDFVTGVKGNVAFFTDILDGEEYTLELTFYGSKLNVKEKHLTGYFGINVSFDGQYHRKESETHIDLEIPDDKPRFHINYMRLFGAVETPLLMKVLEAEGNFKTIESGIPDYLNVIPDHFSGMRKKLFDFWKGKWDYRDASPLKTPLYVKFSGRKKAGKALFWTSLSPTTGDLFSYARHSDIDGAGNLPNIVNDELKLGLSDEELYTIPGTESNDIGFLFLILTNSSADDVFDVELNYSEFANGLELIYRDDWSQHFSKPEPETIALTDKELEKTSFVSKKLKLASMKAGKSIIWLLSIYRKDENGLPKFYLTDVAQPLTVSFRSGTRVTSEPIRAPYGVEAARMDVPSGWFQQ